MGEENPKTRIYIFKICVEENKIMRSNDRLLGDGGRKILQDFASIYQSTRLIYRKTFGCIHTSVNTSCLARYNNSTKPFFTCSIRNLPILGFILHTGTQLITSYL